MSGSATPVWRVFANFVARGRSRVCKMFYEMNLNGIVLYFRCEK